MQDNALMGVERCILLRDAQVNFLAVVQWPHSKMLPDKDGENSKRSSSAMKNIHHLPQKCSTSAS